jgi:hypothetical protein
LLDDLVFQAAISTRFSTELLKTFTQILYFSVRPAMEWFPKCLATFSAILSGPDREFPFPKRNFPAAHALVRKLRFLVQACYDCRAAAECPGPK